MATKDAVSEYLAEIGRKGGTASGKARMDKLTPEKRSEVASTAAKARWARTAKKRARKRAVSGD